MKLKLLPACVLVCLMIISINRSVAQTTKTTGKWFDSHTWLQGSKRTPSASINKTEFARQYKANKAWWDSAFAYIAHTDLTALTPGRYNLYGNEDVYVNVTETAPKNKEDVMFEVHKAYADIHCVVAGEEMIGIAPYATAVLKKEYDPAKDIAFYNTSAGKFYLSNAKTLFIMFPEKDAHCGGIKVKEGATGTIKKVVVKVRCKG
jgi:YhcH/YjgK/YiaL family protein